MENFVNNVRLIEEAFQYSGVLDDNSTIVIGKKINEGFEVFSVNTMWHLTIPSIIIIMFKYKKVV